ncbi:hypothetical protein [Nocardia cyriacigeorgica]|nr:hypothetical protein [Nocardia cyriacigeorgica]BDU04678.1 hypothetical protein FMUBM48_09410 [Nocardia cyriacigeorgica]
MVQVKSYTVEQLKQQRDDILARVRMSLEQFREKASSYSLVGNEWNDWEDLQSIEFLLGNRA